MKEADQDVEIDPSQALDDANLMVEGAILSDSELMLEEEFDDMQEWEQGEITDVMEEEEIFEHETAAEENGEADQDITGVVSEKLQMKSTTKAEVTGTGGASKKRTVPHFVSPRKKLLAKAAS